jgi:phosphomannomutase
MNFEPDGNFPAHVPNPAKWENIEPLVRRVQAEGADLGLAYDGDADRSVAVLPDGRVMGGSEMTAALADEFLRECPDALCAVSMTTSRRCLDFLRSRGPEPAIVPVGHAKVKRLMRRRKEIDFAGEESGHYFYREFFCCESSLITTLRVLGMAASGRLQALMARLPGTWHSPRHEPSFPFAERPRALSASHEVALHALEMFPEPDEVMCEIEGRIERRCDERQIRSSSGVRADYADWWFAVRPSGTEPLARLTGEARE